MFAARACYDPGKAAKVWKHLKNNDSGKEFEVFSTHPANETRYVSLLLPSHGLLLYAPSTHSFPLSTSNLLVLLAFSLRLENLDVLLPEAYTEWRRSECEAEVREEVLSFREMVKRKLKKVLVW